MYPFDSWKRYVLAHDHIFFIISPQTRMHSSRMRTARSSSRPRGVSTRHPPGTRPPRSRHPQDQTPHPLGPDPPFGAGTPRDQTPPPPGTRPPTPGTRPPGPDPPCGQNSWHTLLKILPCPKLRLHAVKNTVSSKYMCLRLYLYHCYSGFSQMYIIERVCEKPYSMSSFHFMLYIFRDKRQQ